MEKLRYLEKNIIYLGEWGEKIHEYCAIKLLENKNIFQWNLEYYNVQVWSAEEKTDWKSQHNGSKEFPYVILWRHERTWMSTCGREIRKKNSNKENETSEN